MSAWLDEDTSTLDARACTFREYSLFLLFFAPQVTGEMMLVDGGEIHLRGFGRFNLTLWDRVLEELGPITERDTIMVNFGAWYHRFFHDGGAEEWKAWKEDMYELVNERLSNSPAQVRAMHAWCSCALPLRLLLWPH